MAGQAHVVDRRVPLDALRRRPLGRGARTRGPRDRVGDAAGRLRRSGAVGLTYSRTYPGAPWAGWTELRSSWSGTCRPRGRSATSRSCRRRSSPPPSWHGMRDDAPTAIEHLREFDDATRDGPDRVPRAAAARGDPHLPDARRTSSWPRRSPGAGPSSSIRTRNAMSSVRALLAEMRGELERRRGDASRRRRMPGMPGAIRSSARTPWTGWRGARRRSVDDRTRRCADGRRRGDLRRASAIPDAPTDRRRSGPMLLADLVATSEAVASTRSRLAKVEAIARVPAPCRARRDPDRRELPVGRAPPAADRASGWASLRDLPAAGDRADAHGVGGGSTRSLDAADASGPGSVALRREALAIAVRPRDRGGTAIPRACWPAASSGRGRSPASWPTRSREPSAAEPVAVRRAAMLSGDLPAVAVVGG